MLWLLDFVPKTNCLRLAEIEEPDVEVWFIGVMDVEGELGGGVFVEVPDC